MEMNEMSKYQHRNYDGVEQQVNKEGTENRGIVLGIPKDLIWQLTSRRRGPYLQRASTIQSPLRKSDQHPFIQNSGRLLRKIDTIHDVYP